jgi:hypothetical protein
MRGQAVTDAKLLNSANQQNLAHKKDERRTLYFGHKELDSSSKIWKPTVLKILKIPCMTAIVNR